MTLANSAVSGDELSALFVVLALICLCGAAYAAWLKQFLATALLVFVAIVALVFGT